MKLIKNYSLILSFIISTSFVYSQTNTGSPYSLNELGEINFLGNVSSISMGGIDSAIDSIEFNINNPSSLAKLKTTNYLIGTFYKSTGISNSVSTDNINTANINYIAIGVPTKRFGFGFGVLPYSSVGFNLQTTDDYNTENSINSRLFGAEGNINRAFVSIGVPLLKYFSLGATANYNFGKFNYEKFNLIENVNYGIFSISSSEISGFTYNFSSNLSIPLKNDFSLNLVYSLYPEGDLDSFNIESLYTSSTSSVSLESLGDFVDVDLNSRGLENTKLPVPKKSIYSLGLEKKNSWFIGLQYESKLSSNFKNDFLDTQNVSYRDANSFSIGGFIIPDSSSLISYWKRVKYRFGIKNEKKSIIVNNLPINQFSLNLGLGLPVAGLSKANLGLEIGRIGNDDNLIKENYFSLRLGLSLNDVWFIKRKFN
ncbi:MAG: hypothetical protein HOC22_04450 [Cryomorphaceae bacterium]|jgi:hypothetical protein|nr:hypothetical protein [Cryomorphaceae bacterium]MBT3504080.1 hypothetical protein [Cryomorphaceae bacterium]MBT3689216.1 hypothetical protein [Cryomorphaceae bacterium]MBT4222403.1 hypothetical protein [Cryomorphaceae bacterium]MBT4293944.1 hypothetical protein [Cryomorphaceae bacterium]